MELETSVLNISAEIISNLINSNNMEYNQLKGNVCSSVGNDAEINFDLALSFLFLVGKVEYHQNNDIVELII